MENFKKLKTWQKWGVMFFIIHSILVVLNFVMSFALPYIMNNGDYAWVIVAVHVNYIDKPVMPLVVLSERLLPHDQFGSLSDWLVHPICLIFGGIVYAFIGSLIGLIKRKIESKTA